LAGVSREPRIRARVGGLRGGLDSEKNAEQRGGEVHFPVDVNLNFHAATLRGRTLSKHEADY
jgi:hypothetical protein